ncbi:MAG: protein kinase [Planctomycetes bacterium]|nr:protein kinase [Planctomycetota bacterium]
MNDKTISVKSFGTAEEFRAWWDSPEIVKIRQAQPGILEGHSSVRIWLEQSTSQPTVETQFGKYRLFRKLGQGGMGTVHLAWDAMLNRQIALKTLILEDVDSTARFMREARATAKLRHPNIVNVYEAGVVGKTYYLTMDYIEGVSLADMIRDADLSLMPKRIAQIIHDVALALEYAHSNNIIHRDIKPGNILLGKGGQVYLTDFGLAKELSGLDRSLTLSGTAVGTPDYMSPEQAMGQKARIDQRSDIFSLGATLYHTLTGQLPFQGAELYDVLNKVVNSDPPTPSSIIMVHKDLETICLKCLDKNKLRRYQTASELADDLSRYMEGEPIHARRLATLTKIWLKAKKNKVAAIGIISAVFVLLLAVIIWLFYSYKNIQVEQEKKEAQLQMRQAVDYARLLTDAVLSDLSGAHEEALQRRREGETVENLNRIPQRILNSAAYQRAGRDAVNNHLVHYSLGKLYRIVGNNNRAMDEQNKALALAPKYGPSLYERGLLGYIEYAKIMDNLKAEWQRQQAEKRLKMSVEESANLKTSASVKELENEAAKKVLAAASEDLALSVQELPPDSPVRVTAQAIIAFNLGQVDQAAAGFKSVLKKDPAFDDAVIFLASIYDMEDKTTEGLKLLNQAIEVDKGNKAFYEKRVQVSLKLYSFSQSDMYQTSAINDLARILRIQPDNYSALLQRGSIYSKIGWSNCHRGLDPAKYFDKARDDLTKAIEIAPSNPAGYKERSTLNSFYANYCWGMWYMKDTGKDPTEAYLQAAADLGAVLGLNPTDTEALLNRATVWINFGNYKKGRQPDSMPEYLKAVEDATQAIKIGGDQAESWEKRANAWSVMGLYKYETKRSPIEEYKKSEQDYKKALEIEGSGLSSIIWQGLSSLYSCWAIYETGRNQDGTEHYRLSESAITRAINLGRADSTSYQYRAMDRSNWALQLASNGKYQTAIQKCQESVVDWGKAGELNPSMQELVNSKIQELNARIEGLRNAMTDDKQTPRRK